MKFLQKFTEKSREYLSKRSQLFITIYMGLAAFIAYSCMYAFRKPYTVAAFEGLEIWGINYKIVLVISQLIGYTMAKGLGIKFISEIKSENRAKFSLILICYSLLSLFFFYIVPSPDNWVFMILNGLGLGMIYGLVFSFLEGRKITEILSAFLIISFIVSSGFMKTVGKLFLINNVDENLMPLLVGLIFFPIFLLSIYALTLAPSPTKDDEVSRTPRQPMNGLERMRFLNKYGFGLFSLIIVYILMTVFRDLRDNFSLEIWKELGITSTTLFTQTELIIGIIIAINIGIGYAIKSNKNAFFANHFFIILGCLLITVSTKSFLQNYTSPFWWVVLSGLGVYMAYIPFNSVLFDRLLAVLKEKANVGFLFYLADFCGYLGSIVVLICQNYNQKNISYLQLITDMAIWLPIFSILLVIISLLFFTGRINNSISNKKRVAIG